MGQCQYKNLQNEHTCNVDTQFFKDSSQEDLFPDFCYFHQTWKLINDFRERFQNQHAEIKRTEQDSELNKKTEQLFVLLFWFLNRIPNSQTWLINFQQLAETTQKSIINTSGFYFPAKAEKLLINTKNEKIVWNNIIKWENIKVYDVEYLHNSNALSIFGDLFRPLISDIFLQIHNYNEENKIPESNNIYQNLNSGKIIEALIKHLVLDKTYIIKNEVLSNNNSVKEIKKILLCLLKNINVEDIINRNYDISPADIKTLQAKKDSIYFNKIAKFVKLDPVRVNYKNWRNNQFNIFLNNLFDDDLNLKSKNPIFQIIFQKIIFKKDINIIEIKSNSKYLFEFCEFESENITIHSNELEMSKNNVSENVKHIEIAVPFRNLELSQQFSDENPLFSDKTNIYLYDGYNSYQDTKPVNEKEKPIQGKIQYVNLKNVRFYWYNRNEVDRKNHYSNLEKLEFNHCQFNDGHRLYEDFPQEQRTGLLKRLEYNYRYLRKHFDKKGDYIEGNDFHYNYMEAKRKNTKNAWDAFLLGLYGIINGYNTKPERTLYWLFGMFLVFTLLIASVGNFSIKHAIEKDTYVQLTSFPDYCTKLGYSLSYNATNLMPILKSDRFIGIDGWSIGIGIFENIVGVVLIALLVMALRNRFRRSKSEDEFK